MDKDLEKKEAEERLFAEPSKEQLQQEFQEILRKREAYQKQQEEELQEIREEKKRENRKRLYSVAKIAVLVVVVGTCFAMLSMRSEATRMWWLKMTDRDIDAESEHVVNNDENRIITDTAEFEAMAEIEDKTGIPMPELLYKPVGMIYDGYDYGIENKWGKVTYLYGDYIITVDVYTADEDSSYSRSYKGEIINEEQLEIEFGCVNIQELKAKDDIESTSLATWEYKNHQYLIEGKLSFDEMKKIIENIFY